jgi:molybdate transport system substrate-binding protein
MERHLPNFLSSRKVRLISIAVFTAITAILISVVLPNLVPSSTVVESNKKLLVSAAASMTNVMEEIQSIYKQNQASTDINYNFGASGALQRQIEQGAPADVFVSAANKQMDALEAQNLLLPGSRTLIAKNSMVLIVPANSSNISSFEDLKNANINRISIGEPRSVPAGQYAQQVLQNLQLWEQIKTKLVYAKNVRQVLASVESGNADAGLVYATDAKISNQVKVVTTAEEKDHSPIVYPIAILKRTQEVDTAKNFLKFLSSQQAQAVLKKYGFVLP